MTLGPGTRPPVNRDHTNERPTPKIFEGANHHRREGVPGGLPQLFSGSADHLKLQERAQDAPLLLGDALDAIAERHFQSNLSHRTHWYAAVSFRHAISHNVNTVLLQCAPNLFNLLLIHTTNTNATVNPTITVLHNFKLKRDTVQTKNDFPAQ